METKRDTYNPSWEAYDRVRDRATTAISILHRTSEDDEKHELLDAISQTLDVLTGQDERGS